ncbi:MAG: amylo-alpha-1,6-glucosidase [Candidatus Baltobacteraceae bacterium]
MNASSLDPKARSAGHQSAHYTVADNEMATGSTLGSPKAAIVIKATGAIEKMYSPELGADVFGTLVLHHWDARSGVPLSPRRGTFEVLPQEQRHRFSLSNGVRVSETLFVLSSAPRGSDRREVDPPAAFYTVELSNEQEREANIATYASVQVPCTQREMVGASYDRGAHAFVLAGGAQRGMVRIAACSRAPDSYELTRDSAKSSAAAFPGELLNELNTGGPVPVAIFHLEHTLQAREKTQFSFVLTFSLDGEDAALENLRALPDAQDALERTRSYYAQMMDKAIVLTPDPEVNRGALWAKANILRTQNLTSQGWCFVNDPTHSNNSVARDTCWYSFGASYVTPEFCRDSLLWYLDHIEPRGMVVEYFDIRNGGTEDYGLNINDNTPLLVLACWHQYCVTGDRSFLEYAYPRLARAASYILSQRNEQGLIWCTASGTADWGIAGWRNVIGGYRLSGATTEVNSECYAALDTMSRIAEVLDDAKGAQTYKTQACDLKNAINEHLLDRSRKLYYLNIDLDGTKRTDVTCDLVFPVMFGVAEHDVAANIIARLSAPEFWSDAGMHTVPRNDINYGPAHGYGLLGGVWSGPTFWFAFAASAFNAEFMAYALSVTFKHYSQDPRRNNTVPGQFSEWLHGETLTNQGMMLSPWFAPKYLWAALQGAAGLDVTALTPKIAPRPAQRWHWIAARNVLVRGRSASWFAVRRQGVEGVHVYSDYPFDGLDGARIFEEDISSDVFLGGDTAVALAFAAPGRLTLFIANTFDRTVTVAVGIAPKHLSSGRKLRSYNTLRNEWVEQDAFDESGLGHGLPVQIGQHGFCLLELSGP